MDTYLKVLDLQGEDISCSDADKLTIHVRMEQELVDRLEGLQKVISAVHNDVAAADEGSPSVREGQQLQQSLNKSFNDKCETALEKNHTNQENLTAELRVLTHNLKNIRRFQTRTGRGDAAPKSRFIDIQG
ncbi:MAG: hypothetical protein K9L66_02220 [Spirochaetaceae bacterium]|nr:hypothetical protein [Spirochaetaceae bacterium]MCF7947545.1 hypothetical protein [Spirochaetia bacterium]MCF7950469.1 hypothetical protein [Spirochaetaceae bacterium]